MLSLDHIRARKEGADYMPSSWSGWAGLAGILLWLFFFREGYEGLERAWLLFAAVLLPAMMVECVYLRRDRRGLFSSPVRAISWRRIALKCVGLALSFCMVALGYYLFPEYAGSFYEPFYQTLRIGWPLLALICVFSVVYLDSRLPDSEDIYYKLGLSVCTCRMCVAKKDLIQHALQWTVKFYFLPLMWVYCVQSAGYNFVFEGGFQRVYDSLYRLVFVIDLGFVCVGYLVSSRLFDSHMRSADPNASGWLSALICYEPFWSLIGSTYLMYWYSPSWGEWLADSPTLYTAWGCCILASLFLYIWSTVSFGTRFSNLTHRGIIDYGPYSIMKHPAYVGKLVSFLLIQVPWAATSLDHAIKGVLLWAVLAIVYYARAKTEERHLRSVDDTYADYEERLRLRQQRWIRGMLRIMPFPLPKAAGSGGSGLTKDI